ncbi:MAG: DNA-directed RNA polymerase subunit beta' [Alphaproteobacteria bacterium]
MRITVASPEQIRSWSYGEIRKPETINYRTFKPERDGLFCPKIFGPVKDYECLCGKYKRMKFKGMVCEKCGVEVTLAKVRRERMGHIDLASPVAHIWFLKSPPSRIGLLLDMQLKQLEAVLYFEKHIVTDPGLTDLERGKLLSEDDYILAQEEYGEGNFTAKIGAEAIRDMLVAITLSDLVKELKEKIETTNSETEKKKLIKRVRLAENMEKARVRPEWMILDVIPVTPPELRPLVPLDGGRFATSDLNDLYRRVINRNNRLRRLKELHAPDIIVRNEKRMLQEAVDALFDNGRRGRVIVGTNRRPLKSLSDMLKGKQGRFRQNLLGKRVDYSGRSVIVVGPELKLHQCGLPKKMALELFKPFIYARLEASGISPTIKVSRKMVEMESAEVWDALAEVIREHPVLLNRAPTLHRLGIQAFEPVLVEGKAIQLHPLVCAAFNADFDGDQMAVHVPLSLEAQLEARVLMMSTNNILSPANGRPIIVPSQDIVLGLYYLTLEDKEAAGAGSVFASRDEVEHALSGGAIGLHSPIQVRLSVMGEDGEERVERIQTTAGRLQLQRLWPLHRNLSLDLVNRVMTKGAIGEAIDSVYRWCGQKDTVIFCDRVMQLGFLYAGRAGISIGKDDLIIPKEKKGLVDKARSAVRSLEGQYQNGLITKAERHNRVVETWSRCGDDVAEKMMDAIQVGHGVNANSVFMMSDSGARGSVQQIKQLSGMRGLMASPSGEIIETPIIANFKEGLTVLEYFNSTHGARKGLADTALKTANSGYLTRRLVDVAQDAIISEEDCGIDEDLKGKKDVTDEDLKGKGLIMREVRDSGRIVSSLSNRVLGRVALVDVKDPESGDVIVKGGDLIDEGKAGKISETQLVKVWVRSALFCEAKQGLCGKCYGRDLARGTPVNIGEAVGVIAAQSIGEPGTQLTMRTFHVGGAAQRGNEESSVEAALDGKLGIRNRNVIENRDGRIFVMGRNLEVMILDESGVERASYRVPRGAQLLMDEGSDVRKSDRLAEWDYLEPVITEREGVVIFKDLEGGVVKEVEDEVTGLVRRVVTDWRHSSATADKRPRITLRDAEHGDIVESNSGEGARHFLEPDMILEVEDNAEVQPGDILARRPRGATKTRDITGGLPRVVDLFEARRPKDYAIMAEIEGRVEITESKSRRTVFIVPKDESAEKKRYVVTRAQHLLVQHGEWIDKGDLLVDGTPATQDILICKGVEVLAHHLIKEVQEVYRLQGVTINDKHIEVIVRQMLRRHEVMDPGSSDLVRGEYVMRHDLYARNHVLEEAGEDLIEARPVLQGITKASLETDSFISAASFQDTTRVLTEAAISGKVDNLVGLKENVIVGRLIPAGSGATMFEIGRDAEERRRLEEEQKRLALEAAATAAAEAEALAAVEVSVGGDAVVEGEVAA